MPPEPPADQPFDEDAVIRSSYSALADPDGFDALIGIWNRVVGAGPNPDYGKLESPRLALHLQLLTRLLSRKLDQAEGPSLGQLIDARRGHALVMSAEGTVLAANGAAQQDWQAWPGRRFHPEFPNRASAAAFEALVQACQGARGQDNAVFDLGWPDGTFWPAVGSVVPIAPSPSRFIRIQANRARWTPQLAAMMARAFGLSEAECELCGELLRDTQLNPIAARRGTSAETVRKQMQSLLAKTGAGNRRMLVRTIVDFTAEIPPVSAPHPAIPWQDPLGRETVFDAPGNMRLAYSWMGAERGRPVVMVHGPLTGNLLQPSVARELDQAGVKLFTLTRRGFGNSGPLVESCPAEDGARAIAALMDHLGIARCPLIGLVGGTIPAMRLAAMAPGRVSSVVSIGAVFPLDTAEARQHLPLFRRLIINLARPAPAATDYVLRHGYLGLMRSGPEFVLRRAHQDSPVDMATVFGDRALPLAIAAINLMTTQGVNALIHDQALLTNTWATPATRDICHLVLAGTEDCIYPPAQMQQWAATRPGLAIESVPGAGQCIYLTENPAIARIIAAAPAD